MGLRTAKEAPNNREKKIIRSSNSIGLSVQETENIEAIEDRLLNLIRSQHSHEAEESARNNMTQESKQKG